VKKNCDDSIRCRIHLQIPEKSYKNIRNSRGRKLRFNDVALNYNGNDIPVKSLKIRGKTSLYYPKKSFSLKLQKNLDIRGAKDTARVKNCYLTGLTMDKNYIVNYTAYSLLKYLKIFNLAFSYCEVVINNNSQGIYMVMERPEDYAFKTMNSPVLIRRGFDRRIDKIEINKKNQKSSAKYFQQKFKHIYFLCDKYSGSQLYDSLNNQIDMRLYMQWLGFNFIARNGDYTDELYLYYDTAQQRFGIIPWDYDDLFMLYPHEGAEARNAVAGGRFIFSSEDRLDQTIINHKYLYNRYLEELIPLTEKLSNSAMAEVFQETYCSVYPFYLKDDILKTSAFDKYGLTSIEELFININENWRTFCAMRDMVKQQIKSISK